MIVTYTYILEIAHAKSSNIAFTHDYKMEALPENFCYFHTCLGPFPSSSLARHKDGSTTEEDTSNTIQHHHTGRAGLLSLCRVRNLRPQVSDCPSLHQFLQDFISWGILHWFTIWNKKTLHHRNKIWSSKNEQSLRAPSFSPGPFPDLCLTHFYILDPTIQFHFYVTIQNLSRCCLLQEISLPLPI